MKIKLIIGILIILMMLPLVEAIDVTACGNLTGPPDQVTEYKLTQNLTGTQAGGLTCLWVENNVSLDCDGYYITGSGSARGIHGNLALYGIENITIQNCYISNYDIGLDITEVPGGIYIDNNVIYNNDIGLTVDGGTNYILTDNTFFDNIWDFSGWGSNNTLQNCDFDGTFLDVIINYANVTSAAAPGSIPSGYTALGKYINFTSLGQPESWAYVNLSYTSGEVSGMEESNLKWFKLTSGTTDVQNEPDSNWTNGSWILLDNLYDNDVSTAASSVVDVQSYYFANYTKPDDVTNATWWVIAGADNANNTLPNTCFSQDPIQFRIISYNRGAPYSPFVNWFCWNGSAWYEVGSQQTPATYHEAIVWERAWTDDLGPLNEVDSDNNIVYANITEFSSLFGPMGPTGGSGGGSGSVPEFSDIGWILAAVLGGGGFILMRRKINAF